MPDISVSIGGNNTGLQAVLSDTLKRLGALKSGAGSALAPLMKLAAPVLALAGLGAGFAGVTAEITATLHKGRDLHEEMLRTGQSAGAILRLQSAFRVSRLDVDSLAPAINKLQKSLAGANDDGEDTASVFDRLGLNAAALAKQDSASQFAAIGGALQKIQDPAQRTAAVMSIFGKSGGEFLQLFSNPAALSGLTGGLSASQDLMAKNVGLYTHVSNAIDAFVFKAKSGFGLFSGLTAGLAPLLDKLTNFLPKIDLTSLGVQLGSIPGLLIAAFQAGRLEDLISLTFQAGLEKAGDLIMGLGPIIVQALTTVAPIVGNLLLSGGIALINVLAQGVVGFGHYIGAALAVMPEYVPALLSALMGMVQVLGAGLLDIFHKPVIALQAGLEYAIESMIEKLSKIPGAARLFGLQDYKSDSYADIKARREQEGAQFGSKSGTADSIGTAGVDRINSALPTIIDSWKTVGSEALAGFKDGKLIDDNSQSGSGNKPALDALGTLVEKLATGLRPLAGQIAPGSSSAAPPISAKQDKKDAKIDDMVANESLEIDLLKAKATGNKELATQLQRQLDIRRETARLMEGGLAEGSAKDMATQKVDAGIKADAEKASENAAKKPLKDGEDDHRPKFQGAQVRASSLASIGGGGYGRSGTLQSLQQAANNYLKTIAEKLDRKEKEKPDPRPLNHLTPGASGSAMAVLG